MQLRRCPGFVGYKSSRVQIGSGLNGGDDSPRRRCAGRPLSPAYAAKRVKLIFFLFLSPLYARSGERGRRA